MCLAKRIASLQIGAGCCVDLAIWLKERASWGLPLGQEQPAVFQYLMS